MDSRETADPYKTRKSIFVRMNDTRQRELAWEEFYNLYAPMIAGFARRLGGRANEVTDVVQDVITGFYEVSPRFQYDPEKGKFRGFLKTCTFGALRKHIRKAKVAGRSPGDIADADVEIDHVWDDVWEKELLKKAYERVGQRYKDNATFQAFKKVVLEGEPVKKVAADLGISEESVYKAKQRIAVAVGEELEFVRRDVG